MILRPKLFPFVALLSSLWQQGRHKSPMEPGREEEHGPSHGGFLESVLGSDDVISPYALQAVVQSHGPT